MSQSPERREAPRESESAPNGGEDASAKLFIANLTYNTRARDLEDLFGKYGRVKDVHIAEDRDTGRSKGFAFITMESAQEAADAIAGGNGQEIDGRPIKVELSDGGRTRGPRGAPRGGDRRGGGGRSDICYDWQSGRCSRGSSCRFSHDEGAAGGGRGGDDRRDDRGSRGGDRDGGRRDDYRGGRDDYRGGGGRDEYRGRDDHRGGRDEYRGGGGGGGDRGYERRDRDRSRDRF